MELSAPAQRVLGSLVEKAMATPDGYPLSRNALRTACNQKTAREPVMDLGEDDVEAALAELREHGLVLTRYAPGSRVPKFAHLLDEKLDLRPPQIAVLGLLLLRGPQTAGELRNRAGRMFTFPTLEDVELVLGSLADHKFGAWVEPVPRAPGQKEQRHRHLLGPEPPPPGAAADEAREAREQLAVLEAEVEQLREENVRLRAELDQARRDLEDLTAPGA